LLIAQFIILKTFLQILILVSLLCNWLPGNSQTQISGVINQYAAVTSMVGLDGVTVDNATGFSAGDTVMIIQMKGAIFEPTLGNDLSDIKNTGRYEFVAIQQVVGTSIKFRSNLINTYDATQALQIVRVPYYQNAKVVSKLTCTPWDSTRNKSKGGVLALFVADTLELVADVDVSSNGFTGANQTYTGNTTCYQVPNLLNYTKYAFDSAGLKGEGICNIDFPYTRGRGDLGNAGGGGNGFGAGGAGGAGFADGGAGGQASVSCPLINRALGGQGGRAPQNYFAGTTNEQRDRIFMGGGGGSSKNQNLSDGSNGGNGGGIVFIIAQTLKTNNYSIKSNGGNVTTIASNQAGGGGGGGGGSLQLSFDKINGSLNLEVKGGKGGNTGYCSGQGGGGGGGFVWYKGKTLSPGTLNLKGGDPGISSVTPCPGSIPGFSGGDGDSANYLNPVLNGFLFNLIGSNQTVCYGAVPLKLTATLPRGGNGVYSYQWQLRNKSTVNSWINIPGGTDMEYQSPALYDTTDFRRIVKTTQFRPDETSFLVTDTSKWIKIIVKPEIKGLSIEPADTAICYGQNAIKLRGSVAYGGDGGSLDYVWEESADTISWNSTADNQIDFSGTSNQDTKYYRRGVVNSHFCSVYSNKALIRVHPLISGNIISSDTVICNGATPNTLAGVAALSGGAGLNTYRFQWLKNSTDTLHWTPISAADTFQTYNPSALSSNAFYKRVVFSGLRETCKDTSYRIKITVLPLINNNIIHQDQTTICQNTRPNRFLGDHPTGGDNLYRYQWESSIDNKNWSSLLMPSANSDSLNYTHSIISTADPLYFRRTIFSGAYNCCVSSSASIKIILQPKIDNNIIVDTSEICYGQTPAQLKQKDGLTITGGDNLAYSYQWLRKPVDSIYWKDCYVNSSSFQPGALYKTNYYKRKVFSGVCVSLSDSIKINVLSLITGNTKPGGKHEVCENTVPEAFVGPSVSGGKEGVYRYSWDLSVSGDTWDSIGGAHNKDYTSIPLTQNTYFRRIVKSGYNDCCISIGDTFVMNVSKHPSIPEAGNNQKLAFKFLTHLQAKPVAIGWGSWSFKNENITLANLRDSTTEVSNLPFGKSIFYWTTANGSCPVVTDSVIINVDDITRYTGFSPNNGDDVNQYFYIAGAENSKVKKLKVFNRWGGEVYSSDNYQNDWDGTARNGQPLPPDTYFYVFEADGNRIYKGFVVIKR
jgi:gliding motility-associated-like protein